MFSHNVSLHMKRFLQRSYRFSRSAQFCQHMHDSNDARSLQNAPGPEEIGLISKEAGAYFKSLLPTLVNDFIDAPYYKDCPEVASQCRKMLEYNLPYGKKVNSFGAIAFYTSMEDPNKLTEENIRLVNILGWCIQMLHTSYIIVDDIQDGSPTRRGLPCWYLVENVGMQAITDALWIYNGLFMIIKKYLRNHRNYISLVELFHKVSRETAMGQSVDLIYDKRGVPHFPPYNINTYNYIARCKTGPLFTLPVRSALLLCGINDEALHEQVNDVMMEMGRHFQLQNDYLDCFGYKTLTGTTSTDIQKEENYGVLDDNAILAVRSVYDQLDLQNLALIHEDESDKQIRSQIDRLPKKLPHDLFVKLLQTTSTETSTQATVYTATMASSHLQNLCLMHEDESDKQIRSQIDRLPKKLPHDLLMKLLHSIYRRSG
ncbi:farnesyl diphosphate synthase 2-like [Photinus pyralis]|uniref:farnesyl diphosphate synthase 2-like n=1 Tax=Photinus pyralis TaxID=7054 RepID=UPI001267243B|nr:farnesyl diphosphate synthase 2-like [Photinus pyralis]